MARGKTSRAKSRSGGKGKANVKAWAPASARRKSSRRGDFLASCNELWAFCTRLPVIFAFGITMGVCIGITVAEIDELSQGKGPAPSGQLAAAQPQADPTPAHPTPAAPPPEMTEVPTDVAEAEALAPSLPQPLPQPLPRPVYTEETEPNAAPDAVLPNLDAAEAAALPEPAPSPDVAEVAPIESPEPQAQPQPQPQPQAQPQASTDQLAALPSPEIEATPLPAPAPPEKPENTQPKPAATVASIVPAPTPAPAPAKAPLLEPVPDLNMEPAADAPPEIPAVSQAGQPSEDVIVARPLPADAPAWLKNAMASDDPGRRPMIAIVLDDVGVAPQDAEMALGLPGAITLSIMTYAPNAATLADRARAKGHEIMVHMPMEPVDHSVDPGPNALLVGLTEDEIRRRVVWGLTRFGGYVGINNHMGSRFTQYAPGMQIVMQELRSRGLLFLDSRTISSTVGDATATGAGVTHVSRDVFLDNTMSVAAVLQQLQDAESVAQSQGYVVAIGHPHPTTIAALKRWIPEARKSGFVLVPLSAIVKKRDGVTG